jgi:multidrug efflux pump subunit AcrB
VIIINQTVSLTTALFVVPALMEKLRLGKGNFKNLRSFKRSRFTIRITRIYSKVVMAFGRRKAIAVTLLLLGFGLPLYLLPEKLEGEKWYLKVYNSTIGNEWYKGKVRTWFDKITGGALRLFTEKVYDGSYFKNPEETSLFITATLPHGSTLKQADIIISGMETYLKQFDGIKLFQSGIAARNASITVYFKNETRLGAFPLILKGEVISKAIDLGGADWGVYGFGLGFNNSLYEGAGSYSVRLLGYNYDRLLGLAEVMKDSLAQNPRISQIYILSERTWYKPDNTEFVAKVNRVSADVKDLNMSLLYSSLDEWSMIQTAFSEIVTDRGIENVKLRPAGLSGNDLWTLVQRPVLNDSTVFKFSSFSSVEKETTSPVISKKDQQYQVYLQFDYIVSDKSAQRYIK